MGVRDTTCRRCGCDITHLPSHAAFCEPCYIKHRAEAETREREMEEAELQAFLDLDDEAKWVMIFNRLFAN